MLVLSALGISFFILESNMAADFAKDCASKTGIAHQIDLLYMQGRDVLCSQNCPCAVSDKSPF